MAEGTIDEDVMRALENKAAGQDALMEAVKANLFITKTLLLIGYSFDDNDIRTLW